MGHKAKKTEHSGSKKGRGAYWGRKADAKKESSRRRREDGKKAARGAEPPGITDVVRNRPHQQSERSGAPRGRMP
jgi:hypothetical protein